LLNAAAGWREKQSFCEDKSQINIRYWR
jgi:hypothetical protein